MEQRTAAADFAAEWKGRGYEKGETQIFWIQLLRKVLGVTDADSRIIFEDQVRLDNTSFIDARIPESGVLIEQKGCHINLEAKARQSDGAMLTPLEQARRYVVGLPLSQHPRYIVVCNFATFQIYDCEKQQVEIIQLDELPREYHRLGFLADSSKQLRQREMEISLQAGELVGQLYEALLRQYINPESPETLHSLNALCVRLVFCLYAEDAGVFGSHGKFHDYLHAHQSEARNALINLFRVLDTKPEQRDPYMDADLAAFPYVNGGLFADDGTVIPRLTPEIVELILQKASADFDWSMISPTIFGAVFESTLNPQTRRSGGMHYTSIENIHKVTDPLFLDALRDELAEIRSIAVERTRMKKLAEYQEKLAKMTFLDPACGSGNFLTETYLSLRRLENEVISLLNRGQGVFALDDINPIKVSIGQFYGIEINDFAVTVARTALWIAESQMLRETEAIVRMSLDFLPLKSYVNIIEGNALRMDWESVVPKDKLNYIMGNPPFIGARMMAQGSEQKREVEDIFGAIKDVQDLDYVCCWYKKAAQMIQGTEIQVAFVSTNSICQGAQVPILWGVLFRDFHVHIHFAYQSFKWESEAKDNAAVHCIIAGFTTISVSKKYLYTNDAVRCVESISPYLLPGSEVFVEAHKLPVCAVPKMNVGNQPRDGGNLILSPDGMSDVLASEPKLAKWIRPYLGAEEFLKGKKRYCFWLRVATPMDIASSPILSARVKAVRDFRLASRAKTTNQYAKVPALFAQITQQEGKKYIVIPEVSSGSRQYIPMGFLDDGIICSNKLQLVPDASLYHFGILTSSVHMAWMRQVCGRLGMGYDYSSSIVYNTFPWPSVSEKMKEQIESTAQKILSARELYPDVPLTVMYGDKMYLFADLEQAHAANDRAVMQAYGFSPDMDESAIVAELMKMYQKLTEGE